MSLKYFQALFVCVFSDQRRPRPKYVLKISRLGATGINATSSYRPSSCPPCPYHTGTGFSVSCILSLTCSFCFCMAGSLQFTNWLLKNQRRTFVRLQPFCTFQKILQRCNRSNLITLKPFTDSIIFCFTKSRTT